jgi:hypothetical protein
VLVSNTNTNTDSDTLSQKDREFISQVQIGCTERVYRYLGLEEQWKNLILNSKPSKKVLFELLQLTLRDNISDQTKPKFQFTPKDIELK